MPQNFIFTSRANQPGHCWYYSVRFLPVAQRQILMALIDWCTTVRMHIQQCQEPNVAHAQLGFWYTELEKISSNHAQHPVSQQLALICDNQVLPIALLQEYLLSIAMDIDLHRYQTRRELDLYAARRGGYLSVLYTHIMGYEDPHTLIIAKQLGQHLQYLYLLRHLARNLTTQHLYIPLDELEQRGISPTELLRKECSPEFMQWFQQQVQAHQTTFDTLIQSLSVRDRWAQRGQIILKTLYQRSLVPVSSAHYNPLRTSMHLNPLQKLWIAWLTQRREQKFYVQKSG